MFGPFGGILSVSVIWVIDAQPEAVGPEIKN